MSEVRKQNDCHCSVRKFRVKVHVKCSNEHATVRDLTEETTVEELKEKIEGKTGIPGPRQQISYLDKCSLVDDYNLSHYHILPNAKLSLELFQPWHDIIAACCQADLNKLEKVLPPVEHDEASILQQQYLFTVAFVAAHRGHLNILNRVLQFQFDVRYKLPSGRHPLLVAVNQGHLKCTERILGRRVRAYEWNNRKAALSDWQTQDQIKTDMERIQKVMKSREQTTTKRLTRACMFDSQLRTWMGGSFAKRYMCIILDGEKKPRDKTSRRSFKP